MSRSFTRFAVLAAAASAMAVPALAQEGEWSGNVTLTSNYVFRGITQTDEAPMIQGGFDWASDSFYVGTWASAIDYDDGTSAEIDLYAGWTPTVGVFDLDIGAIYYYYPDAPDDPEQNFVEVYAGGSTTLGEFLDVGASVAYSPEFYGEIGPGWYGSTGLALPLNDTVSIDARVGASRFDDLSSADYEDYQVGISGTVFENVGWDIRYFSASDGGDDGVFATISQSFGG